MSLNPNETLNSDTETDEIIGLEGGIVTIAKAHSGGDGVGHHVEVKPDTLESPIPAEVKTTQNGDIAIPTEGDRVLIGYRITGRAIILGTRYGADDTIPDYKPGERVIGHPLSNAHIRLADDGSIRVEGDSGNTIEMKSDGTVVVNGGSNNPITSLSTTKDADGHVTDVSTTKSTDIFVP